MGTGTRMREMKLVVGSRGRTSTELIKYYLQKAHKKTPCDRRFFENGEYGFEQIQSVSWIELTLVQQALHREHACRHAHGGSLV